jgi:hypothetical protein
VVIAMVKAGDFVLLYVISLALVYVLYMIFIVKPFLNRIGDLYARREYMVNLLWLFSFLLLIISSYATTEVIGIHALLVDL